MSFSSVQWDIDITAQSSIVHGEDYSSVGSDTFRLFRREKVIDPSGQPIQVPIISGNSFRGVLRRIGEELTAAALSYEQSLPIPAAHLLTNGGRLAKSARPLTDEAERTLKSLIPQVAVFGGAASGRIMSGLVSVGKVLPEIAELAHILPRPPRAITTLHALADESFAHLSDCRPTTTSAPATDYDDDTSPLARFGVETLPAGTALQSWVRVANATAHQIAFLTEVLDVFSQRGHLGGRIAAGHGAITATSTVTVLRGDLPGTETDWSGALAARSGEAIAALTALT